MAHFKKQRVADLLFGFLAQEIRRLGDPRFEPLSVTAVEVSPDLKTAWVYWSVWKLGQLPGADAPVRENPDEYRSARPGAAELHKLETALRGAVGLLKKRIGEELGLRYTPNLVFRYDESLETASRIEYLVKKAGL